MNITKLSEKQVSMYERICELKDEGLTYKQISTQMNDEGYTSVQGKVLTHNGVWSSYTKIRKHFERKFSTYYPPDVDDVEIIWK